MPFIAKPYLSVALTCLIAPLARGQDSPAVSAEVEQHIQRVVSGLVGNVVVKGDAHATHTLSDRMSELHVPGVSIAVIHHGKIEWARGFGESRLGGLAVNADTLFQAGSISKPVAAMAALSLVQQGMLSLDSDVNTWLATWKLPVDPVTAGKPVTLRELLTHTGGTTVHGFPGYASGDPVPSLVQVLNGVKPANTPAIRSNAVPGSRWQYSGGGYTIMQQILVDVTKEPFPKLLHDLVLAPIGMRHSTYEQPLPRDLQSNAATPYWRSGNPVSGGAHTYPEMAAAGLWTTPTDLAQFAIEVEQSLEGKANHVLSVEMSRQMLHPGLGQWGLGLRIGGKSENPIFSHSGQNEGFVNYFIAYEKGGEGAVVMTNGDGGGLVIDEVVHSIAVEYGWPEGRPRAAVLIDPKVLASYKGTFELRPGFNIVIRVQDGQLTAQGTGQGKIPIFAESETRFFATEVEAEIDFFKDDQGNVTHLVLHQGGQDRTAPKR
jgi:CubicO group peptidase (beta-lactamase class C family)